MCGLSQQKDNRYFEMTFEVLVGFVERAILAVVSHQATKEF